MRPKFVALVAVSALALVGCSSAADPAPEPTSTATVAATSPANAEPSPSAPTAADAEENFLGMMENSIGIDADKYSKNLQPKLESSYWLDRGEELCDEVEPGGAVTMPTGIRSSEEYRIESSIAVAASSYLCPTD